MVIHQKVDISDLSKEDKKFFINFVGTINLNKNFRKKDLI